MTRLVVVQAPLTVLTWAQAQLGLPSEEKDAQPQQEQAGAQPQHPTLPSPPATPSPPTLWQEASARAADLRAQADTVAPRYTSTPGGFIRRQMQEADATKVYHFGSIGRRQDHLASFDALQTRHGIRREQLVLVNVEALPNVGRNAECKDHIGTHWQIGKLLSEHNDIWVAVFAGRARVFGWQLQPGR